MDKKLSAEEMAVGGVQHWDPFLFAFVKQNEKIMSQERRDSGWSLFFFLLYLRMLGGEKEREEGKLW